MTRIDDCFARLAASKRKALVAYLCVGDPTEDESADLALACVRAGADILELGVPFSDPTADGPVIARASQRALAKGGGLGATLRVARKIRAQTDAPIVLFGYYNPLFVRGEGAVVDAAAEAGADALLVVDLPIEESLPLRGAAYAKGISLVPLLAPTSSPARIASLQAAAARFPGGFVYYVSVAGVTGNAEAPLSVASTAAGKLKATLKLPTIVGFGVDTGDKAKLAAKDCDGIAVGTAIVKRIEDGASAEVRLASVTALVAELRAALDAG